MLTADCLELPEIAAAGLTRRATGIGLESCVVDEWLLRFGNSGFTGGIAETLGMDPVGADPKYRTQVLAPGLAKRSRIVLLSQHHDPYGNVCYHD